MAQGDAGRLQLMMQTPSPQVQGGDYKGAFELMQEVCGDHEIPTECWFHDDCQCVTERERERKSPL